VFAVHNLPPAVGFVRQVALLALLGFAVVTLSGPLVAVASVVLSLAVGILAFALVGFLIVAVFRALYRGQRAAWEGLCQAGQSLGRIGQRFLRTSFRLVTFPFRVAAYVVAGILYVAWLVLRKVWIAVRFLGEISLMTLTGVLVGVVMAITTGAPNRDLDTLIVMDALAGGLIAAVAGCALIWREKRAAARTSNGLRPALPG
jgi:hypothetical protein